jgi:hypothetical protein
MGNRHHLYPSQPEPSPLAPEPLVQERGWTLDLLGPWGLQMGPELSRRLSEPWSVCGIFILV